MSRWHEAGCKAPVVTVLDDLPCCTHCFAFASAKPGAENIIPTILSIDAMTERRQQDLKNPKLRSGNQFSCTKRKIFSEINHQEQIRLLRINGRRYSTSIHALVEPTPIRDQLRPSYDVLSYARYRGAANQAEWCPIYIGQYWDVMFIPRTYESVLQAVRNEETDRNVWMECLCVDETNDEEKTCQTILAPQILRGGSTTFMCLGSEMIEEYDSAITILSTLKSIDSTSKYSTSIPPRQTRSLKRLLQHDYFTTVQAIREVVLSRNLTMIYKGRALSWTDHLSECLITHASAPRWLRGTAFRYNHNAKDMLWLLIEASSYYCRDDRDKVFVALALFHMGNVVIDYRMSIEKVFTDVATYLVRCSLLNETILAATTQGKLPGLPSWAPDWRAAIRTSPEPGLYGQKGHELLSEDDTDWDGTASIEFLSCTESHQDTSVTTEDGRLIISGARRLCTIRGMIVARDAKHTKIRIDAGAVGTLMITCSTGFYEPGPDFLFLLPSMNIPVLLRYSSVQDSFALICACVVGRGLATGGIEHLIPWDDPTLSMETIRVSKTSQDVLNLMQDFHSDLQGIQRMHSNLTQQEDTVVAGSALLFQAEAVALDFALLSLTGLLGVESILRERWQRLDQELSWIFLDQRALSVLIHEIDLGLHEPASGRDKLPPGMEEVRSYFQGCGLNLPLICEWDLGKFCRSHSTRTAIERSTTLSEVQSQTPMLSTLRLRLPDIRTWAMISAQLLLLFECSGLALEKSWRDFPGASLMKLWRNTAWCSQNDTNLAREQGQDREHHWSWLDFRSALQMRSEIWAHPVPRKLRLTMNLSLATRLSLRCLGLNLSHQERIEIR